MALTKERKLLLGALGSAGLILAADQVLLGPPRGANASQIAPIEQPIAPTTTTTQAPSAQPGAMEVSLASGEVLDTWNARLGEATAGDGDRATIADPFSITERRESGPADVISPQAFLQQHNLTAVMIGGEIGVALINNKPVRIGQMIAGYRLISVDDRSAELRAGGQSVRLVLPKQKASGS